MKNIYLKKLISVAVGIVWTTCAPNTSAAQSENNFPTKMVTLVVPYTPSSGSDLIARQIAPQLSKRWGKPVIVDNRPGASGNIGANQVAKAQPDGHTLLMAINTFTITPSIYKSLPFDPIKDFTPISLLAEASFAFAINPSVPATDMATLIAYARKNGQRLSYASPGNGTPQHLAMELFKQDQKLDILHVPYKGIQGAVTGLIGGEVQMMVATTHSLRAYAQSGKMRMLAVTGNLRSQSAPDVKTFHEQGISSLDGIDAWYGVLGPAKMPPQLVARINKDIVEVMHSDELKKALEAQGLVLRTNTPEQFNTLIKEDLVRWRKKTAEISFELTP